MPPKTFSLTPALVADHAGSRVICLAAEGFGRRFALHSEHPGPSLNRRLDLPSGSAHVVSPVEAQPKLIAVRIDGPLEQRAGYQGECGGYLDGHDAVADRLCAAFAEGDVLLIVDSPGGAAAGLQQAVERALAAKVAHGRRCTGFADEMIGSAATWWTFTVCDEVFAPPAGMIGSIGARGEHTSIAGMLAKDGIVKTYFADPPDKIAFAPEFPLGAVGESRGNRDVKIAADAFRAAICASAIGVRNGLTPEFLIELGADMLTGQLAVDAGLCDGIESIESVTAYALTLAESEEGSDARTQSTGANATGVRTMFVNGKPGVRAEEKKESEAGREIPTKCAKCAVENEADAKFCKGCGESMATEAVEPPPSSKGPKSSEKPESERAAGHPPPPVAMAPRKMSSTASLATILGATSETPLDLKTAAIKMRASHDWMMSTLAGITGKDSIPEMVGAALNFPDKIAAGKRAMADLGKMQDAADLSERWSLADRLVKVAPHMRSKVLADLHDDAGKRITDAKTGRSVRIRTRYATMDLGAFRGLVSDLEGDAPKKRTNPFDADRDVAKAASEQASAEHGAAPALGNDGKPTAAQIKAVTDNLDKHPTVANLWQQRGSDPKMLPLIAEQYILASSQRGGTQKGVYG